MFLHCLANKNMKLVKLEKKTIVEIYNERMVFDFPKDELRPLNMILGPYEKGTYVCYGINDENSDEILGYAFFVKMDQHYLFDYLAVSDAKRGTGIGTSFLALLKEEFRDSDSVIGEVEDPECAENAEDKERKLRRLRFYLNNGYIDTNVRVKLFGVDYIVLEMNLNNSFDEDRITELYLSHYRKMLPKRLFETMVCIK